MIGTSLRLRMLCQHLAMRRSLVSVTLSQPKPFLALQLTSVNQYTFRFINTSKKNKEHHTIDVYDPEYVNVKKPEGPKTVKDFVDVKSQKNWISFGWNYVDPAEDAHIMKVAMFSIITLCFIVFTYVLYYFPDFSLNDWSLREAYLELDRRERLGLPFIDPNLVDPEKIDLPTDEELGGYKVYT